MVLYYGVGSWWKSRKKNFEKEFIKEGKACINARLDKKSKIQIENRKIFREIFWSIEKEDKIYLKKTERKTGDVIIKAVGIVTYTKDNKVYTKNGFCIKVDWKNVNFDGLKDFNKDDGIKRNTRVFHETNPDIIKKIDELLKK